MRAPASLIAIPLTIGCAVGLLLCQVVGSSAHSGATAAAAAAPGTLAIAATGVAAHRTLAISDTRTAARERAPVPDLFAACAAAAALLALVGSVAALASDTGAGLECAACLSAGALLVGVSSGVDASMRAYRSPIALWFDVHEPGARPIVLRGRLREDASVSQTGVSLLVDVREVEPCEPMDDDAARTPCETRGGVRLSVTGTLAARALAEWRKGRELRVAASLRVPTTYRNPGVPDDQQGLARRGVSLVGSVKSAAMVEVTSPGSRMNEWTSAFRAWVRTVLAATVAPWSVRSAGVAAAIAIGDRTGLAQDDEERLQAAGTYHVIAISGGNIAILTWLLVVAGRWLGASPRAGAAGAIAVLLLYGQVTGPAPSVDRAISAAVLFLIGRLIDLRGPSINILAVAAALGLANSPMAVFDPGFVLSFGATLSILIGVPRLGAAFGLPGFASTGPALPHSIEGAPAPAPDLAGHGGVSDLPPHVTPRAALRLRVRRQLASPLVLIRRLAAAAATVVAATVAAEIVLAPISAALFGRITCAGLLLNVAAIPLMTVVQAASLATLAAWLVDPDLARACGYLVHVAARGLIDSARLVDFAPWLSRELAAPAWGVVGAYYAALILSLLPTRAARTAAALTALLGLLIVVSPHAITRDGVALPPRGWLRIVFLDVGQGDSTLVAFPDGRAYLVDAGGLPAAPLQDPAEGAAFDIGQRVVARALRAFGVRELDTFVLTHADPDHIGGARSLVRSFRPRAIWEGVPVPPHAPLRWLAESADTIGAEWRTVRAGDRLRVGAAELDVLHPPPPEWERQRVRNDDSVVLAVRLGKVSVILPGDIGREGETHVLGHLPPPEAAPIVVLKAPHHGSATSSTRELLARLQPAAVIFSSGRANRFGHPAPVVVERYRAMGTTMFSTASDGAVILDTDGERVEIRTWSGREMTLESATPKMGDDLPRRKPTR